MTKVLTGGLCGTLLETDRMCLGLFAGRGYSLRDSSLSSFPVPLREEERKMPSFPCALQVLWVLSLLSNFLCPSRALRRSR